MSDQEHESAKERSILTTLRGTWNVAQEYHRRFIYTGIGISFYFVLKLAAPVLYAMTISRLFGSVGRTDPPYSLVAIWFLAELATQAASTVIDWNRDELLNRTEASFIGKSLRQLLRLDLGYHETQNTGAKAAKITRGTQHMVNMLITILYDIIPTIAQIAVTLVVFIWAGWPFAVILIVSSTLFIWCSVRLSRATCDISGDIDDDYEAAYARISDVSANIRTVQSSGREREEQASHQVILDRIVRRETERRDIALPWRIVRSFLQNVSRGAMLLCGLILVTRGQLNAAVFVLVFTQSERVFADLFQISRAYERLIDAAGSVGRTLGLLTAMPSITDAPDAIVPVKLRGDIFFDDVTFTYPGTSVPVIEHFTLRIAAGEKVAFVGLSGSGKSTLVKLILRHYDVDSGVILIDDTGIRDYNRSALRQRMAVVSQDVELFDRTVREEISYCKPGATDEEIVAAAKLARAHGFIALLKKAYGTVIGERGLKLSGGQQQRMGIARAILPEPDILILDEATSSLDSKTEQEIKDALREIEEGRTVVAIAHRLSTIMHADTIVVLDDGRIVQQGTHAALIAVGGAYRQLFELQGAGEIVKDVCLRECCLAASDESDSGCTRACCLESLGEAVAV